jgi:hypothetical protein
MGGAEHEVCQLWEVAHHSGQGADGGLDALVGRQQTGGENQRAPGQPEARLIGIAVAAHIGNTVMNEGDLFARHALRHKEAHGARAHHDDLR